MADSLSAHFLSALIVVVTALIVAAPPLAVYWILTPCPRLIVIRLALFSALSPQLVAWIPSMAQSDQDGRGFVPTEWLYVGLTFSLLSWLTVVWGVLMLHSWGDFRWPCSYRNRSQM